MNLPDETLALMRLLEAKADAIAVIQQLLRTTLVVPVTLPNGEQGGALPLTAERDGVMSVIAFVTPEDAEKVKDTTPYAVTMAGAAYIRQIPAGVGLVLFSGSGNAAFEPSLIEGIRGDLDAADAGVTTTPDAGGVA